MLQRAIDAFWGVGIGLIEQGILPDRITRIGIRKRLADLLLENERDFKDVSSPTEKFLKELEAVPIAVEEDKANAQHYEVPTAYFDFALGARKKYSSCLWEKAKTLEEAEEEMLALTVARAEVTDGMRILDLGCGWGSLSLYIAEHFPNTTITAFSNSRTQKEYIDRVAKEKGFQNITVVTGNAKNGVPEGTFDRILSVEMLEHVRNHRALFGQLRERLAPDGKFFVHVFSHHTYPFLYEDTSKRADWMAREFFSGGIMPSHDLLPLAGAEYFEVEHDWKVNGTHYGKTLRAWLERHDAKEEKIVSIFRGAGVKEPRKTAERWRLFYIACEELFNYKEGKEWSVSHYLFKVK